MPAPRSGLSYDPMPVQAGDEAAGLVYSNKDMQFPRAYAALLLRPVFRTDFWRLTLLLRAVMYGVCLGAAVFGYAAVAKASHQTDLTVAHETAERDAFGRQQSSIAAYHQLKLKLADYAAEGVDTTGVVAALGQIAKDISGGQYATANQEVGAQSGSLDSLLKQTEDAAAVKAAIEAKKGTLLGILADGATLLAGATITLFQNGQSVMTATTDASGAYSLHVDAGSYSAQVVMPGYDTLTKDSLTVLAQQTASPTLVLTKMPAPTPVPTAVLTATPTAAPKATAAKPAATPTTAQPFASTTDSTDYSSYSRTTIASDRGSFGADIMTFDLSSGHIRVVADTADDGDCANNCSVKSVQSFVNANGAFAGINGTYFCPTSYSACGGQTNFFYWKILNPRLGQMINASDGLGEQDPFIAFAQNGRATFFNHWSDYANSGLNGYSGISCKPIVVSGGQYAVNDNDLDSKQLTTKSARGAIGLKGQTLYVVVVQNATVGDLGYAMQALGVDSAMNIDGGGSTAMVYNGSYKRGPGRSVPNALVFVQQ